MDMMNTATIAENVRMMKMAEFSEVMKRWREICKSRNALPGYICKGCSLEHNPVCGYLEIATDKEIEDAENNILNQEGDEK